MMTTISDSRSLEVPQNYWNWRLWLQEANPILTLRGALLLVFCVWLLVGPARSETDIIASVFGWSFLGLLCASALTTIVAGMNRRRYYSLHVEIVPAAAGSQPQEGARIISGEPHRLLSHIGKLNLPPFFEFSFALEFANPGLITARHRLRGRSLRKSAVTEEIIFPHRGVWQVKGAQCSFGDILGLTTLNWRTEQHEVKRSFEVFPREAAPLEVPVISSSVRPGDDVLDMNERQGEPFDIKPYHPADGVRKIVWKMYAKSGDLLSRHPERSMHPEGQVIIFCAAGKKDDELCAAALAYVKQLEALELQVFVGCLGLAGRSIAHNRPAAEKLLVESVWDSDEAEPRLELGELLNQAQKHLSDAQLSSVVLFYPQHAFSAFESAQSAEDIGSLLGEKHIQPVFIVQEEAAATPQRSTISPQWEPVRRLWLRMVPYLISYAASDLEKGRNLLDQFLQHCARRQWLVYRIPAWR